MSVREHITKSISNLNETELRQVEEFLAFLKFQSRVRANPVPDEMQLSSLYGEFSKEDSLLAEQGMEDYFEGLTKEDE